MLSKQLSLKMCSPFRGYYRTSRGDGYEGGKFSGSDTRSSLSCSVFRNMYRSTRNSEDVDVSYDYFRFGLTVSGGLSYVKSVKMRRPRDTEAEIVTESQARVNLQFSHQKPKFPPPPWSILFPYL